MLRLFTNIPLPHHIILLILAVVVRIPSFYIFPLSDEEALLFLSAKKIAAGQNLYTDAWISIPPVSVWIYYLLYSIYPPLAIITIRIASIIYLYICAAYFNAVILNFKAIKRYSLLPSILMISLISCPWFNQSCYPSFIATLPIMASFFTIIQLKNQRRRNMFKVGLMMALSVFIAYKLAILVIGMIITYVIINRAKATEILAMISGIVLGTTFICVILYLNQNLSAYWDVAILFYVDRFMLFGTSVYQYQPYISLLSWGISWGPLFICAVSAIFHFRAKYFSYVVKIRSLEAMMILWLLTGVLMIFIKYERLELSDFLLIIPPICFYASKAFDLANVYKFRFFILISSLIVPIIQYTTYVQNGPEQMYKETQPTYPWLYPVTLTNGQLPEDILVFLKEKTEYKAVWILDYQPSWYIHLQKDCPNKYIDTRILIGKHDLFSPKDPKGLLSKPESHRKFYLAFDKGVPHYVIDPYERFPLLLKKYPLLFQHFQLKEELDLPIYEKQLNQSNLQK